MSSILEKAAGALSARAIVFDKDMRCVAAGSEKFARHLSASVGGQQGPLDMPRTTLATRRVAPKRKGVQATCLTVVGITKRYEKIVDCHCSIRVVSQGAIDWQDRSDSPVCQEMPDASDRGPVTDQSGSADKPAMERRLEPEIGDEGRMTKHTARKRAVMAAQSLS